MQDMAFVRLNKYLSMAGTCSRREADRLIEEGYVTVNGQKALPGMKVGPDDRVCLKGETIRPETEKIILAVYKPCGVVCTTDTRWGEKRLNDIVDVGKRVFYVGRLDKASRGLILMTNQGELANQIMRAANCHEKEYLVTVDRKITQAFLHRLREGVWLEELHVRTRACEVEQTGESTFRIILTQGLNRQIRRMCEACGYHVTDLLRTRILNIQLGELKPGTFRSLTREEVEILSEKAGLQV